MNLKMLTRTGATVALCLFITACGEIVEQNQTALVLKTLGDRTAETVNIEAGEFLVSDTEGGTKYTAQRVSAVRAPLQTPGTEVLKFNLGLQSYRFTVNPSVESPHNEEFVLDSRGGKIRTDVVVQMYIDETFPDLDRRLVAFMQAYRLRQYSGSADVLDAFVQDRLARLLRVPFVNYTASREAFGIMRNKQEINEIATNHMNEQFNQYGIRFAMVGIASDMRIPPKQQNDMDAIVLREMTAEATSIETKKLKPIQQRISTLNEEGVTKSEEHINTARSEAATLVAKAQKARKSRLIQLLSQGGNDGATSYASLEQLITMATALSSGQTQVRVVPDGAQILFDGSNLSAATAAAAK